MGMAAVAGLGTAAFAGDGPVLSAESFSFGCFPAPPTLPVPLTYFLFATPTPPQALGGLGGRLPGSAELCSQRTQRETDEFPAGGGQREPFVAFGIFPVSLPNQQSLAHCVFQQTESLRGLEAFGVGGLIPE